MKAEAKTLHAGVGNYCWFSDPAKALCLKLAGTPDADEPLMGICDSARCPQAVSTKDPTIAAIERFFTAYAANDVDGIAQVLSEDIERAIPGHHPLAGTKHGIAEVHSFFDQLGKTGFRAKPLLLEANEEYVVDVHRGWSTEGVGKVDTIWALVRTSVPTARSTTW